MKNVNEKLRLAYSLKETAEMIGVSEGHLRNETKRGRLKLSKSNDRTLILAVELQRYLSALPDSRMTEVVRRAGRRQKGSK